MSMTSRRALLGAGAGALALAATGASAQSTPTRLRAFWWGNPDRDRRTRAAFDLYQNRGAVQIASEASGWGDYWTKLATQTAGGNPPDLIQMDYRYIYEYSRRGVLADLGPHTPRPLDLGTFSKSGRDAGTVDGKIYGVTLGVNSKAAVIDTTMFERVGVTTIDPAWTWDDMARIAAEISKINPGRYWGTGDNSRWEQGFEHWLNQRGKLLYTAEGRAAFSRDDVAEWFAFWDRLRKAGICAPAEVAALATGSIDQYEIPRGLAAISYANSNQVVAFQSVSRNKLAINLFPNLPGARSGHYVKPAMLMSIAARSRNQTAAAQLINFLVNEAEGVRTLGIERGVPASARSGEMLAPDLDDLGRMQVDFMARIERVAVDLPPPPPRGAGEIEVLLRRVGDAVAFGRTSVSDGAAQFLREAEGILARA